MSHNINKNKKRPAGALSSKEKRDLRYTTREHLRAFTSLKRVRDCGTPMGDVGVKVLKSHDGSRHAGFAGLETCGSQACPVCAAKIAYKRQQEIGQVVREHIAFNGSVVMLTLTMRHNKGDSLQELWDAMSVAWKAATNGSGWRKDRSEFGVHHYVRVVEVTHGANGWHVHVHALLLGDLRLKDDVIRLDLATRMFSRWSKKLTSLGLKAPIFAKGGADIRYINPSEGVAETIAEYVSKSGMGVTLPESLRYDDKDKISQALRDEAKKDLDKARKIAFEIARSDLKDGKRGNRTPWQILSDYIDFSSSQDLALWINYEEVSKGRRTITWSRGLRDKYGLGAELSDEEIAAEEQGGALEALIPMAEYRAGTRITPRFPALVLNAVENGGRKELDELLVQMGLQPSLDSGLLVQWEKGDSLRLEDGKVLRFPTKRPVTIF